VQGRVARLLNVGGFIAPVLWVAAFLYSGSLLPEYSHYRQYVSELAARGTPTQHFMRVTGFVIPGLLIVGFGYVLGVSARTWLVAIAASVLIVSGMARAVAGVFPLDACCTSAPQSTSQAIHNIAGGVYYFTLAMAALMWTVAARQMFGRRSDWFRWYSLTSVVLAIAAPSVLLWMGAATSADVGLFQRVSFGLLNLWIFVLAALTWSRPAASASGPIVSSR
jgi:hypothetical membrane protein